MIHYIPVLFFRDTSVIVPTKNNKKLNIRIFKLAIQHEENCKNSETFTQNYNEKYL